MSPIGTLYDMLSKFNFGGVKKDGLFIHGQQDERGLNNTPRTAAGDSNVGTGSTDDT